MQNYTNYHVAYYDDGSMNTTYEEVIRYIKSRKIDSDKIKVYKNKKSMIENLRKAAFTDCKA